jgi:hypothetical protein
MTYPQQPGNWSDPNWQAQQPAGYPDQPPGGYPEQPTVGYPEQPPAGYPDPQAAGYPDPGYQVSGQPVGMPGQPVPGYPAYGYPVAVNPPTNGLAIASLVLALVGIGTCITAPVGAILGHIARRQIRERGEGGDGMAKAGIIVGWILTGLMLLLLAFYVVVIVIAINADTHSGSY